MDRLIDRRYRILAELGSGGMGTVYKVEDATTGRTLALKVLASEGERQRDRLLRFRREFRAASSLVHPNIIAVHEFVSGRISYFTMEYVAGKDVATYFGIGDKAPRPPRPEDLNQPERIRRLFSVLHQVLLALGYMHDREIVHRDLKPENIVVSDAALPALPGSTAPLVKVMDFGLARDLRDTAQLTQPGVVLGTLAYLSPEQATGRPVDGRADLYALGVVLYLLLTGTLPFPPDSVSNLLWKHSAETPEPPRARNPGVHRMLESVCVRLLRKDPFDRYQTAGELLRLVEKTGRGTYDLPEPVELLARGGDRMGGQVFAPRLVGRENELAAIADRIEDAAHGRGGVVWLHGDSGVGKTRLLAEANDLARGLAVRVLGARFHSGDPRPFGALADLFAELPAAIRILPREDAARVVGPGARALADLAPAFLDLEAVRRLAPRPALAGPARRRQLTAAAIDLIAGWLRRGPLAIVLDDVHFADALAVQLIDELAAALASRAVSSERPSGLLLLLAGAGAGPAPAGRAIEVRPLGAPHALLLARSMLGQEIEDGRPAARLFELSAGVPYVHAELTRAWVSLQALRFEGGRWHADLNRLPVDLGGEDLIRLDLERRLGSLSAPARDLVEVAALFGREADFDLLAAATGLPEAVAIDAVEELIRARFLRESPEEGRLDIGHERVRAVILAAIGGEHRADLHVRLLHGLEMFHRGRLEAHVVELAHHAYHGNERAKALVYLPQAAARLQAIGASDEAQVVAERVVL